jgi:hypothetical protein
VAQAPFLRAFALASSLFEKRRSRHFSEFALQGRATVRTALLEAWQPGILLAAVTTAFAKAASGAGDWIGDTGGGAGDSRRVVIFADQGFQRPAAVLNDLNTGLLEDRARIWAHPPGNHPINLARYQASSRLDTGAAG